MVLYHQTREVCYGVNSDYPSTPRHSEDQSNRIVDLLQRLNLFHHYFLDENWCPSSVDGATHGIRASHSNYFDILDFVLWLRNPNCWGVSLLKHEFYLGRTSFFLKLNKNKYHIETSDHSTVDWPIFLSIFIWPFIINSPDFKSR